MARLVVVSPLSALQAGDGFSLAGWPLHVTIAPTFETDAEISQVETIMRKVAESHPPLTVTADAGEGFGRRGNIPVTVIATSDELQTLHEALVDALGAVGARFDDPDFIRSGYRAHVTKTRTAAAVPGQVIDLTQLALVDMAPEGDSRLRRVVKSYSLDGRGT
jgi:2'-5' RNA ligase